MKIRLNEIPKEGRNYTFNRESEELNDTLADIVGDHAYDVEFFIKPIGNAYELRGKLKTAITEVCSHCGWDFEMPIDRPLREILFEENVDEHRKTHSVHGNQSVNFLDDGTSMYSVQNDLFDAADYVHESIALAEPFYPMCGGDKCLREDEVQKLKEQVNSEFATAEEKAPGHPAFSVLKGLDLSKKT